MNINHTNHKPFDNVIYYIDKSDPHKDVCR